MHRLIKAFGFCAYFISPNGAKKLNAKLFPLSLVTTKIPLITNQMPATTIDRAGCREYSQLDAFICQPFLAYTPNTDSSTRAQINRNILILYQLLAFTLLFKIARKDLTLSLLRFSSPNSLLPYPASYSRMVMVFFHVTATSRSNLSAITCLQNNEIFK